MTNDTERVTQLIGDIIAESIDRVPDPEVIGATKQLVHETLDNGFINDPEGYIGVEWKIWQLAQLLGLDPGNPWAAEQAIFALIDQYDLFND